MPSGDDPRTPESGADMSDRDRDFAEFVVSSSAALQRTAYLVCADRHQAHDAVQEALYRLYLAWPA